MSKIKLGAIALISIVTCISAFSAKKRKAEEVRSKLNAPYMGSFTYCIYSTLTGGTRLVTTNFIPCAGGTYPCDVRFNSPYQLDGPTKWEPGANIIAILSHHY